MLNVHNKTITFAWFYFCSLYKLRVHKRRLYPLTVVVLYRMINTNYFYKHGTIKRG